jgi:hypothetical protein
MKTKERLSQALREAKAPTEMIEHAEIGGYDDFEAVDTASPIVDLVNACRAFGLDDLAKRAMNGEFDATEEEAEAWARSEDGQQTMRRFGGAR